MKFELLFFWKIRCSFGSWVRVSFWWFRPHPDLRLRLRLRLEVKPQLFWKNPKMKEKLENILIALQFPSANDPKSSIPERREPSAQKFWASSFPWKIFSTFCEKNYENWKINTINFSNMLICLNIEGTTFKKK